MKKNVPEKIEILLPGGEELRRLKDAISLFMKEAADRADDLEKEDESVKN